MRGRYILIDKESGEQRCSDLVALEYPQASDNTGMGYCHKPVGHKGQHQATPPDKHDSFPRVWRNRPKPPITRAVGSLGNRLDAKLVKAGKLRG